MKNPKEGISDMERIFYDDEKNPEKKGKKNRDVSIKVGNVFSKSGVERKFFKLVKSFIIYVLISFFVGFGVSIFVGGGLFIIFGLCLTVFIVCRILIFVRDRQEDIP